MRIKGRGWASALASATSVAMVAAAAVIGMQAPASAAGGHWELTQANTYSWAPAVLRSPLSYDGTSGFPYRWSVRGGYTGGQLTSVGVTEYNDLNPPSSCTWQYEWTLPPTTAVEGQSLAMTMKSTGSCAGNPWFWDVGFDYANIEPGVTSGWSYDGVYYKPPGKGTYQGTVKFPAASSVVNHPQTPGQMRLQVKAERWAIQYVYTWVKDADPPAPQPGVTAPGAPQSVTLKAISSKKARASWQPPATGSAPTSYTAHARSKAPGGKWTGWAQQNTTSTSIGMKVRKRGSRIQFYVVASNSAGTGPQSATVTKKLPRK